MSYVTKEGSFTRAGVENVNEAEIYRVLSQKRHQSGASSKRLLLQGAENKISLVQTYSKTFHCTYLLQDYPFDTQVCSTD